MTPEAQRIAIAEACGWSPVYPGHPPCVQVWKKPGASGNSMVKDFDINSTLPNYLGDLNAMHEAASTLLFSKRQRYRELLQDIMGRRLNPPGRVTIDECIDATASDRAEAFLKAIGKWEGA